MTRYGGYDLDKIKQALGQKDWEVVLRPFCHVRLATASQIEEATGLSRRVVGRTLRAMLALEDVAEDPGGAGVADTDPDRGEAEARPEERVRYVLTKAPHRMAYRAYHTKPATVYLLGQVGAALLRELGLVKKLRACAEYRPLALAHSLCILDLILLGQAQGQTVLLAEKELQSGEGLVLRADVALPQFAEGKVVAWRMAAVEQAADERNADRVERQVERWRAFFAGAPGAEPVSPVMLLLFNLKQDALPAALAEWRDALAVVTAKTAKSGALPFELRYRLLVDFMKEPAWPAADWARYPRLFPEAKPVRLAEPRRDPLDQWPAQADLLGLFEKAVAIHALSRGDGRPLLAQYSVPVASVRALRAWLDSAEMAETRRKLVEALEKLQARTAGLIAVSILTKLAWDIVLRRFGVERKHLGLRGEFQVWFALPELAGQGRTAAGYGDYYARVSMDTQFFEDTRKAGLAPATASLESLATALEWLLTALYTYAYELGLREQPWLAPDPRRTRKDKKQK